MQVFVVLHVSVLHVAMLPSGQVAWFELSGQSTLVPSGHSAGHFNTCSYSLQTFLTSEGHS